MAVTYRSSGTIVANGDAGVDMSSNLPSGLAIDDIMVFQGGDADNDAFNTGLPSGWTHFVGNATNNNLGGSIAWKRRTGSESDWQFDTVSGNGQVVWGVIHAFEGAITSGNPISFGGMNSVAQRTTHATTFSGVTGELKIAFHCIEDDVAVTRISDGDWTERDNQTTTVGSDGRMIMETSTDETGGSTTSSYTTGASEYSFSVSMRLKPVPTTPRSNKLRSFIMS